MLGILVVWAVLSDGGPDPAAAFDVGFGTPWYANEEDAEVSDEAALTSFLLPGLVDYHEVAWTLDVFGFDVEQDNSPIEARLHGEGLVTHPFEGEIEALDLAVGLFPSADAEAVHARLRKPPLALTQADLDTPLPEPLAALVGGDFHIESFDDEGHHQVAFDHDLGTLPMSLVQPPKLLVLSSNYRLKSPSVRDIERILHTGGTADAAALARWADEQREPTSEMDPGDRKHIMEVVRERLLSMRAPPALGDFHRLSALDALISTLGGPEDLEPLLKLERPIKILHTSAVLSFDLAVREEAFLGLPIHGMRDLPTRSTFLDAPNLAFKALRGPAIDRLLRLAFDPLDFRDAPVAMVKRRSPLAHQAAALLSPLTTTDVSGVLATATGRADVEREIMRFYLEVHHAPAVEHVADWLVEHPGDVEDLGRLSVQELPAAMLPALVQRYIEPREPEHRGVMRKLLESLPSELAPAVLDLFRSLGLELPEPSRSGGREQIREALDLFESVERRLAVARAQTLLRRLLEAGTEISTLRSSLRDIARLAQLDPEALQEHAPAILAILTAAAWEFDAESSADQSRAIGYLDSLPWGAATPSAERARVLVEAQLDARHGRSDAALGSLQHFDETLADPEVRAGFIEILRRQFDEQIERGAYGDAAATLSLAERTVADDLDLDSLRAQLMWAQYKPAFFLGAAFALALTSTLTWLVLGQLMALIARRRQTRKQMDRLLRRRADAEANSADAAAFVDEAFGEAGTALDGLHLPIPDEERYEFDDDPVMEPMPLVESEAQRVGGVSGPSRRVDLTTKPDGPKGRPSEGTPVSAGEDLGDGPDDYGIGTEPVDDPRDRPLDPTLAAERLI